MSGFTDTANRWPGDIEGVDPESQPEQEKRQAEERALQVKQWWDQCRLTQQESRREMALDEDYLDGLQWSDADKAALEERGQAPLVFNLIALNHRWLTGTEKRTRIDYKVAGRKKEGSKDAETKTQLLKYLSDANNAGFHRSKAFAECASVGIGWLEEGIRGDSEDEPLYFRAESWRNVWYDPMAVEPDYSDGRYLFRVRWVDLDIAQAMFPQFKEQLQTVAEQFALGGFREQEDVLGNPALYGGSAVAGSTLDYNNRKRVRLVECWYRQPEAVQVLKGAGQPWHGSIYQGDPVQADAVTSGVASTYDAIRMVTRSMVFADSPRDIGRGIPLILQDTPSPYWHNRFPLTPVWGYRRKRDNTPYGLVRGMRDAQDDYNKRRSKALHLLATNQIVAEEGSVADWNEAVGEAQRPDGVVRLLPGGKKFEIRNQAVLAQSHVALMEHDARHIQEAAGITDENLGRNTNAISGKAIEARQNQGYTTSADLFDNLRLAIQLSGEKQLSLVEQYYTEEKTVRITGERSTNYATINDSATGENIITRLKADFVVDEQDYRTTVRQAMFETVLDFTTKLPPEIGLKMLALAFEMSDLPMRDEFVKVLREATGMADPNAEPDPQAMAGQQAQQQEQQQLQQRQVLAQLQVLEGKAREVEAKASKEQLQAINQKLAALRQALEVATAAADAPHLAKVADQIYAEAQNVHIPTAQQVAASRQVNNIEPQQQPPQGVSA